MTIHDESNAVLMNWVPSGWWWMFLLVGVPAVVVLGTFLGSGAARPGKRDEAEEVQRNWTRWEFWPPWLFYAPVGFYCVWLAVKYRGLSLPSVANPGIFTGGIVGNSKMATLAQLMETSPQFTPATVLIDAGDGPDRLRMLREACARHNITPPFILKPDLGQRGAGVKLVRNWQHAEQALAAAVPLLLQRYSPGPFELGVFYYRFPGEPQGRIFAVTEKVFPELTGDGVSTVEQLILGDARARLMRHVYLRRFAARRSEVLGAGVRLRLVEAGNHAQGCIFRNGSKLLTPELERAIDGIAKRLDGFCIGRFDIRYGDPAALARGEGFEIVELNGASSEATSIYDARNSLWTAYRTLFRQWNLVFAIGAANRAAGHRGESWRAVWREWRRYRKLANSYAPAD